MPFGWLCSGKKEKQYSENRFVLALLQTLVTHPCWAPLQVGAPSQQGQGHFHHLCCLEQWHSAGSDDHPISGSAAWRLASMLPVVCRPWHCLGGQSFAAAACDHSSARAQTVSKLQYVCMQAHSAAHNQQIACTHHVQNQNVCRCVYAVLMTVHDPCKSQCSREMSEAVCHSPWVFCMLHSIAVQSAPEHVCAQVSVCVCACAYVCKRQHISQPCLQHMHVIALRHVCGHACL